MSNYYINWQSGQNGSSENQSIPGKQQIVLPQKTINDTASSVPLTGRLVPDYGLIQQENWLRSMENFASATPPIHPTVGQEWFDPFANILYICVDASKVAQDIPLYLSNGTIGWQQVWPRSEVFAGLVKYNALATILNGVIQRQGLTDFVPTYSDVNTLVSFNTSFPTQFDNRAWVILLARLRKALRTSLLAEDNVSPVGFISDGRPAVGGEPLANTFNQGSTLPTFTSGYKNFSVQELELCYNNTINTLTLLNQAVP